MDTPKRNAFRRLGPALLAALALSGLGAGCEEPFPPETQVDRLRVLAIRAEPPELDVFGTTTLDALVADPLGAGRAVELSWGVCLIELGSTATDIPCPGPDSYPLPGQGTSASLSMPALLAWLEEMGFEVDPGTGELPDVDDIPLFVGVEARAGSESVRALKRVKIRLQGDQPYNTNPQIAGLEIDGVPWAGTPALVIDAKHDLNPLVTEDSRDLFLPDGEVEERLEDLLFSWFSTGGEFENQRTILDVDRGGTPLQVNEFRLPDEPGTYSLWLIVRDGRFGLDWAEYSFEVAE